jgi:hypothetical protein
MLNVYIDTYMIIYTHTYPCTYTHTYSERENKIVSASLSEGTTGGRRGKENVRE